MKPFWGVEITDSNGDNKINGEEFLVFSAPAALPEKPDAEAETDAEGDDVTTDKKKTNSDGQYLPLWLRVIRFVSGALSLLALVLLVRTYFGISGQSYVTYYFDRYPWAFYLGGAFILIWMAINIAEGILESKAKKREEAENGGEVFDESASDAMNIPDDVAHTDILVFCYTVANGETVAVADEEALSSYSNMDVRAFADSENLYLATLEDKYAFPLESLRGIRKVDEEIAIPDWNKDVPPTKGEYKKYGMSVDNLDRVTLSPYYVLELEREGEEWGIYFPCYELNTFESLTGLHA